MKKGDRSIGMRSKQVKLSVFLVFAALGLAEVCFGPGGWMVGSTSAQDSNKQDSRASTSLAGAVAAQKAAKADAAITSTPAKNDTRQEHAMEGDQLTPKSAAAFEPDWKRPYPQYQSVGKDLVLLPFPNLGP